MLQEFARLGVLGLALRRDAQEPVGQHKPRRLDEVNRKTHDHTSGPSLASGAGKLGVEPGFALGETLDQAAEALLPADRLPGLELGLVALPALEVLGPDERPVDPWRGDLEAVGALHGIIGIEQGGKRS